MKIIKLRRKDMSEVFVKKERKTLTPATTVLMTIFFTLLAVVVVRIILFIITGA